MANSAGTNGPRNPKTTGRLRQKLTNIASKQDPFPSTIVRRDKPADQGRPQPRPQPALKAPERSQAPDVRASTEKLAALTKPRVPSQPTSSLQAPTVQAPPVVPQQPTATQMPMGEGGSQKANIALGKAMAANLYGWTGAEWKALYTLWMRESSWRSSAVNPSSGAAGIPQALPSAHPGLVNQQWMNDPRAQIMWGLRYIAQRYGSPLAALAHSDENHWY